jgi:N-acyl-D-aspartate/D-glutamate deacylase
MLAALCAFVLLLPPSGEDPAVWLIKGGLVFDGSAHPAQVMDVLIRGDRIAAMGAGIAAPVGAKVVNASGLIVAPGFIDLHTHSDTEIVAAQTRDNLNYLKQGVTTIVTGNCGLGQIEVVSFLDTVAKQGAGSNVCHLIPHNALRQKVMGNVNRPPSPAELKTMQDLIDEAMRAGAWGLATGLFYTPGAYADLTELVELSKVVARHGGIYASHIRDESGGLLASVNEAIEVGRQAKLPVHISHFKAAGRPHWGTAAAAVALVQQARAAGQAVTADQYPYIAASTSLSATLIPPKFREGTSAEMLARLDDPERGPAMRQAMAELIKLSRDGADIRIARFKPNPAWQGKDLATIARETGKSTLDLAIEIERGGGAQIVHFSMSEPDLRIIMTQPFVATASDGSGKVPDDTVPHPRNYGTFPRKIGTYAIEEKWLPIEQAIHSATGLPADILRLPERGYLKVGHFADVVVFDPKTFRDRSTFDKPHQYATGVKYLWVNGTPVLADEKPTGALPGRALRHPSRAAP